jgi:hypothetical protein
MMADFEDDGTPVRIIRRAEIPKADASGPKASELLEVVRKLLAREPVAPTVTVTPTMQSSAPAVNVTIAPRPSRTVKCAVSRDEYGRIETIVFTELDHG